MLNGKFPLSHRQTRNRRPRRTRSWFFCNREVSRRILLPRRLTRQQNNRWTVRLSRSRLCLRNIVRMRAARASRSDIPGRRRSQTLRQWKLRMWRYRHWNNRRCWCWPRHRWTEDLIRIRKLRNRTRSTGRTSRRRSLIMVFHLNGRFIRRRSKARSRS